MFQFLRQHRTPLCCAALPVLAQVKASHVTEADYNRAAAGDWITPAPRPAVPPAAATARFGSIPGLGAATLPGLSSLPGFPAGLIPGLPGSAPLAVPALPGAIPGLGNAAALMAFPPPP